MAVIIMFKQASKIDRLVVMTLVAFCVVLDCTDSWSLHPYLLFSEYQNKTPKNIQYLGQTFGWKNIFKPPVGSTAVWSKDMILLLLIHS